MEGPFPAKWFEWSKHIHAIYSFDDKTHEETFDILAMGYNTAPSLITKVNLPVAVEPRCQVVVRNRCLMTAMEKVTYPEDARRASAVGRIVLRGSISPGGGVTGIQVFEADVSPGRKREALVKAAIEDLQTWQFNAADREQPIEITYSYAIDESLTRGDQPVVRWTEPARVSVRANRP